MGCGGGGGGGAIKSWKSVVSPSRLLRKSTSGSWRTQNLVLFGTEIDIKTDTVFDLVILQAKQFIYKCKLDKCLPALSCFLQQLMLKYKIDEYNAKISGELPTFILNGLCYKPILTTENLTSGHM